MSAIKVDEVKEKLREFVNTYHRPLRGKLLALEPFKDELLKLDAKSVPPAEVSAFLAQNGITVSKDTILRFLRIVKKRERSDRTKKTNPPPPADTTKSSKPAPRLLPRHLMPQT